ncbi:hypothetical protein EH243_00035 [Amphritea opalescens]|uniref:Uncharacterized protein n=1 Tax=Amphritea opalescens TaxID=2490544 RepID=A0A430KV65_9GAMM|nr:hypothetical protein [Amphritea opalescens]RTE67379.1 hypothetical protein EH243_00035 [Amphritea opalescens]
MSSEYLDWTALDSRAEPRADSNKLASSVRSAEAGISALTTAPDTAQRPLTQLLEMGDVPDELKALVNRQQLLAQQLDELTGHTVAPDWNEQRFSMPQHSAQSRLADKQQAQRQESCRSRVRQQINQRSLTRLRLDRGLKEAELARLEKLKQKKRQALQMQQRLAQLEQQKRKALQDNAQRRLKEVQRQWEQGYQRHQRILTQALERRQALMKAYEADGQKRQRLEQACLLQRQEQQDWQAQRERQLQARENASSDARIAAKRQQDILAEQLAKSEAKREQRLANIARDRQIERLAARRAMAKQEKKLFFS